MKNCMKIAEDVVMNDAITIVENLVSCSKPLHNQSGTELTALVANIKRKKNSPEQTKKVKKTLYTSLSYSSGACFESLLCYPDNLLLTLMALGIFSMPPAS